MTSSITNSTVTYQLTPTTTNNKCGAEFTQAEYVWIARHMWNVEYAPGRFHAIVLRARSQRAGHVTCLLFRSGRVVMTGLRAPHLHGAYMARRVCRLMLHQAGAGLTAQRCAQLRVRNVRVRNIVGTAASGGRNNGFGTTQ
jgi:TATA-box binding protein (TBP) (component of TFIID and TFIIIB)